MGLPPLVTFPSVTTRITAVGVQTLTRSREQPRIHMAVVKGNLGADFLHRCVQSQLDGDVVSETAEFGPGSSLPTGTCLQHKLGRRIFKHAGNARELDFRVDGYVSGVLLVHDRGQFGHGSGKDAQLRHDRHAMKGFFFGKVRHAL